MEKEKIAKSTFVITILTALNILVGFCLQVILAAKFGASKYMDAYLAASTFPMLIIMVTQGALTVAFLPVLVECITNKKDDISEIVNSFFNSALIILAIIVAFCFLNISGIISLIVPGFSGEVFDLTVNIAKILLPTVVFMGLTSVLSSIYYARKMFTMPAAAPVINNGVIFIFVIIFAKKLGIMSVAWGAFLGAVMQFVFLLPVLIPDYKLKIDLYNQSLKKIAVLILPLFIGALFDKTNNLIERYFSSGFSEGTITCLGYAYKMMFVISMIATRGINLSLFPVMSENSAGNRMGEFRMTFSIGIRTVLIILVPIIVIVGILREPMIMLFFERGAFTHKATMMTGVALLAYSGALFGLSICSILNFAFYAMQDTLTVVKIGVLGAFLNAALAYYLSAYLGFKGLPLAYSIIILIQTAVLGIILRKRWGHIDGKNILITFVKTSTAAGSAGIIIYILMYVLRMGAWFNSLFLFVMFLVACGALFYIAICYFLKMNEVRFIENMLFSKTRNQ